MSSHNNKRRGQVQLILGPMFSGKTSELIRRLKRYETANHKCMVIRYAKDVRYDDENNQGSITTHDRNRLNATLNASLLAEVEPFAHPYSVIGIDEGQFVSNFFVFSSLFIIHLLSFVVLVQRRGRLLRNDG